MYVFLIGLGLYWFEKNIVTFLQCTLKTYMHLLYILQYNVNFTGVGWQIGCRRF